MIVVLTMPTTTSASEKQLEKEPDRPGQVIQPYLRQRCKYVLDHTLTRALAVPTDSEPDSTTCLLFRLAAAWVTFTSATPSRARSARDNADPAPLTSAMAHRLLHCPFAKHELSLVALNDTRLVQQSPRYFRKA